MAKSSRPVRISLNTVPPLPSFGLLEVAPPRRDVYDDRRDREGHGLDEVTLRFRAKQGYWHVSDVAIDNLFVQDHVFTPYELWALTTFAGAPGGTDTSESGNPDGDRFSNLQEWALVLDPLTADLPPMHISINDPNFFVTYDRRIGSGLTVRAGWATSVTSTVWRLNGDGLTEVSIGSTDDVETIAAFVPLDGTNKFIRVEVEE